MKDMLTRFIFQFILVLTLTAKVLSTEYGPSILSLVRPTTATIPPAASGLPFLTSFEPTHYVQRFLRLESFKNHAAVLPLADGRPWIRSEEIREILGTESLHNAVPFMVLPPANHGIMVVIQELQIPAINTFNQSLIVIDDNGDIFDCFSKFVFQIEGKSPVHVCGRTNKHDKFRPGAIDGVGPRSFVVPVGKSIMVGFTYRDQRIDKSSSLTMQVPFYDEGYMFQASIAFTAYSACPRGPPYYDGNNNKLWPCDIPANSREPVGACIREGHFCDKVINCGMHDSHEFAVDERFCKDDTDMMETDAFAANLSLPNEDGKGLALNVRKLEESINKRIINSERPFGYNEIQWGRPRPNSPKPPAANKGTGNPYTPEPVKDQVSHPAFVALVIMISIICVLIIGLLFRYCCKTCVGGMNSFGESSQPEQVNRYFENLRNRDDSNGGRSNGGFGISLDSFFKPVEDLPPSYDDLFPQPQTLDTDGRDKVQDNIITSSQQQASSNLTGIIFTTRSSQNPQSSASISPSPPIYTIPIVAQQLQSTSSSHNFLDRTASAGSNSSENNMDHCIINPAFVCVEVLPGPMGLGYENEGRRSSEQRASLDVGSRRLSND